MNQPKAIVADNRNEFKALCQKHNWNPYQIHYVQRCYVHGRIKGFEGFYVEEVYPDFGDMLPKRPHAE